MKLLGRMAYMICRSLRKDKVALLDEVETQWRVSLFDVDLYGHMNNGRYSMIMDLARIDYSIRIGALPYVFKQGLKGVVASAHLQFKSSLKPFQKYQIHTRLLYWDDRAFYFRHEFRSASGPQNEKERVHAICYVRTVFVRRSTILRSNDVFTITGYENNRPPLDPELLTRFPQLSESIGCREKVSMNQRI